MKTDWLAMSLAFQIGFCGNAVLWRLVKGETDYILFPAAITVICAASLIVHIAVSRDSRHED